MGFPKDKHQEQFSFATGVGSCSSRIILFAPFWMRIPREKEKTRMLFAQKLDELQPEKCV